MDSNTKEVLSDLIHWCGWLALAALLVAGCSSCSREAWRVPMAMPADSVALQLPVGKYKFTGPVNFTIQKGNNNVATATATGKVKADAAAIGPGSSARATQAGTPWYVFAGILLGGFIAGAWVRGRFSFFSFIR